jgi:hypothetical protein
MIVAKPKQWLEDDPNNDPRQFIKKTSVKTESSKLIK